MDPAGRFDGVGAVRASNRLGRLGELDRGKERQVDKVCVVKKEGATTVG